MTELAGQQFNSGDDDHASATLRLVQKYAEKIHMGVAEDGKKMKNAEQLMRAHVVSADRHPQCCFL